jgi:type I restriction enzyme R subunit
MMCASSYCAESAEVSGFTESVVEKAALAWLAAIGWTIKHGPEIAPGELAAERSDFGDIVLAQRLRDALARLNPTLPPEALEEAFRRLTRPEGADPVARNRAVHRLLVDGVTVEYRTRSGEIRGAQAKVIDYDEPGANDWLAVNQLGVIEGKHSRRPDVVLYVSGLPLAVIELKNAADENATIWGAFNQIQTTRPRSLRSSPPTPWSWCPMASWRGSAHSRLGESGSSRGGRSRERL